MKKSTMLKWLFVVIVIAFCIIKFVTANGVETPIMEEEDFDVPVMVLNESEPPAIKVNILTKEDVEEKEVEIDKTKPHFNLEISEASFSIYSNDLTRISTDGSGEYFYYKFKDENELTVYLQKKEDMISLDEMESNYADTTFCKENNINVFRKEKLNDGILYLLSYDGSLTPDVIEVWRENEKAILNVYYVNYEEGINEETVNSIKDFMNYIKDTTAKG